MSTDALHQRAEAVRAFNRFYTQQIGALKAHLLGSDFSLTEARILYELGHSTNMTTTALCQQLDLDAGYLSRVISGFEKKGWVCKTRSTSDARVTLLTLTPAGQAILAPLETAARNEIIDQLVPLSTPAQQQLVEAMGNIQTILGEQNRSYLLRDPQPGDMGLIVAYQAMLYAKEYGWNSEYEALVAEIVAKYLRDFDQSCERCWIAEQDGKMIGSIFVVREDDHTAKLRLLYVDPSARGMGVGSRLVEECLRFARQAGYTRMILWTNSVLTGARRIYEKAGFQLVEEAPHHCFGKDLVGQVWEKVLLE